MKKSTSTLIRDGVGAAGGFVAANVLTNKIPAVAANPILKVVAPAGGAILVTKFLGRKAAGIAAGMVAASVVNAVQEYAPGLATQAGIAGPPYKSLHIPGVAGRSYLSNTASKVEVKMQ